MGGPLHRLPGRVRPASAGERRPRRSSTSPRSGPRPPPCAASRSRHAARRLRATRGAPVAQGREPPADRGVQDPRRLRRHRRPRPRRPGPRRHHLLVGQPRPGRRPRGTAARRPGRRRHALATRRPSSAPASRPTAPRSSSSARPPTSASRSPSGWPPDRGLAIIPPYDDDRIIAGQGTVGLEIAEDLPDVALVLVPIGGGGLASGVAVGDQGAAPGRAGHRRRAGAGRRRARVAGARRDRPLAGRARVADDRRRHADAVDRRAPVRPPARAARRRRDRHRGGDRRRRPAGRRTSRASSSSRRARSSSPPSPSTRAELGLTTGAARPSPSSAAATSIPRAYLDYLATPLPD